MNPALDCSVVTCGLGNWDLFFSIASNAAQLAGRCRPAGTNKSWYVDGNSDAYDVNLFDDPIGELSNERDFPADAYTHYADYPAFHGVGDNDSIPNLQGLWSTTASAASTLPSTGFDSASWGGISNALQEDESWATIQPSSIEDLGPAPGGGYPNWAGSDYIVLTGYNFSIPSDATIVSVVAGMKGYGYYSLVEDGPYGSHFSGYGYGNAGGVFNAGLMSGGVLYPFADPSTICRYGPQTLAQVLANNPHAHPPWPNDPGTQYLHTIGVPDSPGIWTQARSLDWPLVIDPSWYPSPNPNVAAPPMPNQSQVGITPLIRMSPVPGFGPMFVGNLTGCPNLSLTNYIEAHNGPVQKNMNLTPTKQVWTPAEINDPSFGVAVSVWTDSTTFSTPDQTVAMQSYLFLNCIGIGVYYIPGSGGGGGGGDNPLSKRPKVWIST